MVTSRTAIITGAAGFLGHAVARRLHRAGFRVIGIDRNPPRDAEAFAFWCQTDVADSETTAELLRTAQPHCLLHFAGRADVGRSLREPLDDFLHGPALFVRLLDAVRRFSPTTKVLLASSAAVYGQPRTLPIHEDHEAQPLSPYGFHKAMSESAAREFHQVYGLATAVVRIFSAYGPGLRKQLLWDLCQRCLQGEVVLAGTGDETRDFIHADDIGEAIRLVVERAEFRAERINVASGRGTTVRRMAELVLTGMGVPRELLHFSGQSRPGDPRDFEADVNRLRGLGFETAIPLATGVADYAKWFQTDAAKGVPLAA